MGLVETRYDHPEQKFLAVEYTDEEVNVYRFLSAKEEGEEQRSPEWLQINRTFFSEDDFLTFGGQWNEESMEARKVTVLRRKTNAEEGVKVVSAEGFSLRALTETKDTFLILRKVTEQVCREERYHAMKQELDEISYQVVELALDNCYENGAMNPSFELWSEDYPEMTEIQVHKEDLLHEAPYTLNDGVVWTTFV